MGEGDVVSEKLAPVANGKAEVDKKAKVKEQPDGVTEREEDKRSEEKFEAQHIDVDKEEAKESKEIEEKAEGEKVAKEGKKEEGKEKKEETKADQEKQETMPEDGGKEELKNEKMEEEAEERTKKGIEENVKEDDDGVKGEEEKPEELKEKKGSKKRPRSKSSAGKKGKMKKKESAEEKKEQKTSTEKKTKDSKTSVQEKEKEPKTPTASTIERPVRERKSVERLVAAIEKDSAKEFHIEKGRGTALKDIPNVAYKLSRKKTEDTFKLLHTILFGRRGKAAQVKNNISRFSGFVWHDNEEKQMNRLKEKLDKCVKEKLVEFCDVLDVPISKANTRKEDIIAKLIEFLVEPHATTSDLLAEKEQGKKRKRVEKSASGSSTPSKGSAKSRKKAESASKKVGETKSTLHESDDELEEEKEREEDMNGVPERSDDEMPEEAAREEKGSEEESDGDKGKQKRGSAKSSVKKGSSQKSKTKKVTISEKTSPPPKKVPAKSPSRSKRNDDTSAKKSLGKKKEEEVKKSSTPKPLKEGPGKKILKVKDKAKEETLKPSDHELKNSICKILKEVDFNTATFTDILKLLGKQFHTDLTSRKSTIKLMIQDELTKLADADEADEEEDEGGAEKDKKNLSNVSVKA